MIRCWCGYLSGVRCRLFVYGPADATAIPKTPSSLASFKSRLVLPFCYRLTHVVLAKRPLNGCSSSSLYLLHCSVYRCCTQPSVLACPYQVLAEIHKQNRNIIKQDQDRDRAEAVSKTKTERQNTAFCQTNLIPTSQVKLVKFADA